MVINTRVIVIAMVSVVWVADAHRARMDLGFRVAIQPVCAQV